MVDTAYDTNTYKTRFTKGEVSKPLFGDIEF